MGDIVHDGHLRVRETRDLDLANALLTKSLQKQEVFGTYYAGHRRHDWYKTSVYWLRITTLLI